MPKDIKNFVKYMLEKKKLKKRSVDSNALNNGLFIFVSFKFKKKFNVYWYLEQLRSKKIHKKIDKKKQNKDMLKLLFCILFWSHFFKLPMQIRIIPKNNILVINNNM